MNPEALDGLLRDVAPPLDQPELLALLKEAQALAGGALSPALQGRIAQAAGVPPSVVAALVRVTPSLKASACRHVITVCLGKGCRAHGAYPLLKAVQRTLGVATGQTTPDGRFRLATRTCLKRCGAGPNLLVDGDLHTGVTPARLPAILSQYP